MDFKLAALLDSGMAGSGAALVPDYNVIGLGHQIDHAAFSLVAPVDSDNCGTSVHASSTFQAGLFSFQQSHRLKHGSL